LKEFGKARDFLRAFFFLEFPCTALQGTLVLELCTHFQIKKERRLRPLFFNLKNASRLGEALPVRAGKFQKEKAPHKIGVSKFQKEIILRIGKRCLVNRCDVTRV
jgi:hypothetical protein